MRLLRYSATLIGTQMGAVCNIRHQGCRVPPTEISSSSEQHFLRVYIFEKGMFHLPMGIPSS